MVETPREMVKKKSKRLQCHTNMTPKFFLPNIFHLWITIKYVWSGIIRDTTQLVMFYYIRQVIPECLGYLYVNCASTGLLGPKLNDLLQTLILQDSCSSISPGKKNKQRGKLSNSPSKAVWFLKKKKKSLKLGMLTSNCCKF